MSPNTTPFHFLYPSDPLKTTRPDEFYATEIEAVDGTMRIVEIGDGQVSDLWAGLRLSSQVVGLRPV
jgi:hypothetical protein